MNVRSSAGKAHSLPSALHHTQLGCRAAWPRPCENIANRRPGVFTERAHIGQARTDQPASPPHRPEFNPIAAIRPLINGRSKRTRKRRRSLDCRQSVVSGADQRRSFTIINDNGCFCRKSPCSFQDPARATLMAVCGWKPDVDLTSAADDHSTSVERSVTSLQMSMRVQASLRYWHHRPPPAPQARHAPALGGHRQTRTAAMP